MDCRHERLRTIGNRVFCCGCGEELPLEFLMAKNKPVKAEKQAEKAAPAERRIKPRSKKERLKRPFKEEKQNDPDHVL